MRSRKPPETRGSWAGRWASCPWNRERWSPKKSYLSPRKSSGAGPYSEAAAPGFPFDTQSFHVRGRLLKGQSAQAKEFGRLYDWSFGSGAWESLNTSGPTNLPGLSSVCDSFDPDGLGPRSHQIESSLLFSLPKEQGS